MDFLLKNKMVILLGFAGILFSCQFEKDTRNIQAFYYPVETLTAGTVYEYHPVNNPELPVEYVFLKNLKTDSATYLTGQFYDHHFTVRQFFSAEMVSNGVLMNDYSIYDFDSLRNATKRPAEILAPNAYPFEVKDSTGVFLFKLKWNNPEVEDAYIELIRNRRFKGNAEFIFKNQNIECVEFKVQELVDDYNNGHLEKKYNGKELYGKGLGLVYYKKEIDENFVQEYTLVDTFSMNIFEQKFQKYLSEQTQE